MHGQARKSLNQLIPKKIPIVIKIKKMKVLYFLFLFLGELCALARVKYLIYIEFIII